MFCELSTLVTDSLIGKHQHLRSHSLLQRHPCHEFVKFYGYNLTWDRSRKRSERLTCVHSKIAARIDGRKLHWSKFENAKSLPVQLSLLLSWIWFKRHLRPFKLALQKRFFPVVEKIGKTTLYARFSAPEKLNCIRRFISKTKITSGFVLHHFWT